MGDETKPGFLAKVAAATARRARELEVPAPNTVPGTYLDWDSTGGLSPGLEHRLTTVEVRGKELRNAVQTLDGEVRSMRADVGRLRQVVDRANVLNQQVADSLAAIAERTDGDGREISKLGRWKAQVAGIAIGATMTISAVGWLIERAVR